LTKCDYMSSLRYVFGKRAHVMTETIADHSRAMTIVMIVIMLFIAMT